MASGCTRRDENIYDPFYYYEGEKVPLKQIEDKIFIQFANPARLELGPINWAQWETDWAQWNVLIKSDVTLQLYNGNSSGYGAFLETKNGKPIPPATIEYFKSSPVVASVSYMFEIEHTGALQGLKNEFMVKLKETTSYGQLLQFAEQNHCKIREDKMDKNYFVMMVDKTSALDAMQTSELFYETNLFEFAEPYFVWINQFTVCDNKMIRQVLKDEPAYIRKGCFEHLGRIDAYYLELAYSHSDFHGPRVFPVEDIPAQYRKDGLFVYISGNVTCCWVSGECGEPNIRLASIPLFELKSIKINK